MAESETLQADYDSRTKEYEVRQWQHRPTRRRGGILYVNWPLTTSVISSLDREIRNGQIGQRTRIARKERSQATREEEARRLKAEETQEISD